MKNKEYKRTLMVALAMNLPTTKVDYESLCYNMVKQYLTLTSMDIYVCCLDVDKYKDLSKEYGNRLKVNKYTLDYINKDVESGMEEYLKLNALIEGYQWSNGSYDAYYLMDGDLTLSGWDEESYQEMIKREDVDVWTTTPLIRNYDDDNPLRPYLTPKRLLAHREDRMIYTNSDKLGKMINLWLNLDVWDNVFNIDINGNRMGNGEWYKGIGGMGFMMALSYMHIGAKAIVVPRDTYEFTKYEQVIRKEDGKILDRWWNLPPRWWSMDNVGNGPKVIPTPLTKEEIDYINNGITTISH
jgi:hypothetical protein